MVGNFIPQLAGAEVTMQPLSFKAPLPKAIAGFTDEEIQTALEEKFGLSTFRGEQQSIVKHIANGSDALVIMPTGGGKSLCFQLPAILRKGLCVVVSPLVSLINNQVDLLTGMGRSARPYSSSESAGDRSITLEALESDPISLEFLYITPESLRSHMILDKLDRLNARRQLALFAIDEAHCISQWGHDFRKAYNQLGKVKRRFDRVPMVALTATATKPVMDDICKSLNITAARRFVTSFDRPNIRYEVRYERRLNELETSCFDDLIEVLTTNPGPAIIYCITRDECHAMCRHLSSHGVTAEPYHAGMPDDDRRGNMDNWVLGSTRVIVGTIAFGMGIDKPDVRVVVHWGPSKSVAGFYQESGRAGRDGKPALSVVYVSTSLVRLVEGMAGREGKAQGFREVMDVFMRNSCRRRALLSFFGDDGRGANPTCCDVCSDPTEVASGIVAQGGNANEAGHNRTKKGTGAQGRRAVVKPRAGPMNATELWARIKAEKREKLKAERRHAAVEDTVEEDAVQEGEGFSIAQEPIEEETAPAPTVSRFSQGLTQTPQSPQVSQSGGTTVDSDKQNATVEHLRIMLRISRPTALQLERLVRTECPSEPAYGTMVLRVQGHVYSLSRTHRSGASLFAAEADKHMRGGGRLGDLLRADP
ncbi:DNA helicase ATP-dependent RecQ type [Carpediemonas membranifera]|uniref:DNA 3'-5' helicase n=1 Tax=Carpediemonas membranifera TaxID=201153 RepID=A0A8J6AZ14_9EUKA|nr:DNA helicase ATP-dependent RecQ type [Carpediemonas membranifera]|eukprot:KAG9395825.1 DNA helicase ATP-dependent RecQ type [Carpediemonas membranifera]